MHCKQHSVSASSECERTSCDARCGKGEEDERSWLASAVLCHLNTKTDCTLSLLIWVLFCFVFSSVKIERGQIINFSTTAYFSFYRRRPNIDTKYRNINYIKVKKAVVSDKHQTFASVYLFLPMFYKERHANSYHFHVTIIPLVFRYIRGLSRNFVLVAFC